MTFPLVTLQSYFYLTKGITMSTLWAMNQIKRYSPGIRTKNRSKPIPRTKPVWNTSVESTKRLIPLVIEQLGYLTLIDVLNQVGITLPEMYELVNHTKREAVWRELVRIKKQRNAMLPNGFSLW